MVHTAILPRQLVHHKVRDFGKWKPFIDRHESTRKISCSKSALVFQNIEDPTDVGILFEQDLVKNARKFGTSGDLKKIMERAGVIGTPQIYSIKEIQKNNA